MTDAEIQQFQTDKQRKLNQAIAKPHGWQKGVTKENSPSDHVYGFYILFAWGELTGQKNLLVSVY